MTLTEFSYYSRRMLPLAIIGLLLFLIFFYLIRVVLLYQEASRPKHIYDKKFGNIKKPLIKEASSANGFTYTLDTIEGTPVTSTDSAQIFFIPPSTSRFGFREKIYVMAKTFGFDPSVKHKLNGSEAEFTDTNRKLDIDVTNFNFTYEYDVKNDTSIFNNVSVPQQRIVEDAAADFLRKVGRYPEELAKGKMNTTYHIYNPTTHDLEVTKRPQDANVVEVDFYRPDVDAVPQNLSYVSPKYFNSQNYVIMVFNDTGLQVIKSQVRFFEKSEGQVDAYPIKTGDTAYEDLKAGKASVISLPGTTKNISIKKMFLAYFDPDQYQEYLQPVYVFIGDQNFVGYVPAVLDSYASE